MRKILVKSGVKQLPLFESENYPYFEAYLRGDETDQELESLVSNKMKLITLHMPGKVSNGTAYVETNFCNENASYAFRELERYVNFAEKHDVSYIVLHLGTFNSFKDKRELVLAAVADRMNQIKTSKVKICVENIPIWLNLSFVNESVLYHPDHFKYLEKLCPQLGLVLDIDHLALTTIFDQFYQQNRLGYLEANDKESFLVELEKDIAKTVKSNPEKYQRITNQAIKDFFSQVTPVGVHAVGSDFCNYVDYRNLPLIGEALPLNYNGEINGVLTRNRLDHSIWVSLLPENTFITLELLIRKEYNYLDQIKNDWNYLQKLLNYS